MRFKVLEENNIEYLVQRTKAKSMSFTFKRDGVVVVRIPYLYTKDLAKDADMLYIPMYMASLL